MEYNKRVLTRNIKYTGNVLKFSSFWNRSPTSKNDPNFNRILPQLWLYPIKPIIQTTFDQWLLFLTLNCVNYGQGYEIWPIGQLIRNGRSSQRHPFSEGVLSRRIGGKSALQLPVMTWELGSCCRRGNMPPISTLKDTKDFEIWISRDF